MSLPTDAADESDEERELRIDAVYIVVANLAGIAIALPFLVTHWSWSTGSLIFFAVVVAVMAATGMAVSRDMSAQGHPSRLWGLAAFFTWPIGPVLYLGSRLYMARAKRQETKA